MGSLYERIEHLGKAGGYKNMTVLCKAAGVPRTTMSELNAGRSKDLSKPNAQKFADLLGISLDDIYGTEKQKPATKGDELKIGPAYLSLAREMQANGIHPDDVKAILEVLERQKNDKG